MPELPDIELYLHSLRREVVGKAIRQVRIMSPFLVRSVAPAPEELVGRTLHEVFRIGKRIVFQFETQDAESAKCSPGGDSLYLAVHLMIAGRLRWLKSGAKGPGKIMQSAFDFDDGTLALTEAGKKKRASIHIVANEADLRKHDPGGLEVMDASMAEFAAALIRENHTIKRALTDPRILSGIGNAYSDEILHAARLSPFLHTSKLTEAQVQRLYDSTRETLNAWTAKLRKEFANRFPGAGDVTAFRNDFAVHGRFEKPCPVCGDPVQRIRYADNETNYCATCQTEGRILADRSLSRLLKDDWPRSFDDDGQA